MKQKYTTTWVLLLACSMFVSFAAMNAVAGQLNRCKRGSKCPNGVTCPTMNCHSKHGCKCKDVGKNDCECVQDVKPRLTCDPADLKKCLSP